MGTQNLILIALGVIMVGIAIAVGISMFMNQGYNSNRQSLATEMSTYPPSVIKYWGLNKIMGGAGANPANLTQEKLASYLGFIDPNYSHTSENGEFRITGINGTSVTITALGFNTRFNKRARITTVINVETKEVTTSFDTASSW
jgi:hypothetical protein